MNSKYKKLADYIQQHRRNKRLSIRKISQLTNLPETTIRALENPNRNNLPTSNVRGLYKVYGATLGIPGKRVDDLIGEQEELKPEFNLKRLPKLKSLVVFSNIGLTTLVAVILVTILGYASWQGLGLISSPNLEISYPEQEYTVVDESSFEVSGSAPIESSVFVNGQPTTVDNETGEFAQIVFLQAGYNFVTVEVVNSFLTSALENFVVIYKLPVRAALDFH